MRKAIWIIVGLLLVAGSIGGFAYRYAMPEARIIALPPVPAEAGAKKSLRTARKPRPADKTPSLAMFDRVIDVLNLIIGMTGIWLAITGVRMRREAGQTIAARSDR